MPLSRRTFLAGAALPLLAPAARAAAPRWTDVHLHVIDREGRQMGPAVEAAVAAMDAAGLRKAVVFPPPYPPPGAADYQHYVPELRRYPGRFGFLAGGGTLNPAIQAAAGQPVSAPARQAFKDEARRMLDAGAVGFGEIAALHLSLVPNHPFEEVAPDHPLMLALAEVAGEAGAVIDLHMDPVVQAGGMRPQGGLPVPPNPAVLQGNVAAFERLLAHHRGARIVWAHGGSDFTGNMTPALIGRLMKVHANLHMSLRPVPLVAVRRNPFNLPFQNLLLTGNGIEPAWLSLLHAYPDRFVLGADTFFLGPSANPQGAVAILARGNEVRLTGARVLIERLPPALAGRISVENAARLYRL
jgi:hypothetical protein